MRGLCALRNRPKGQLMQQVAWSRHTICEDANGCECCSRPSAMELSLYSFNSLACAIYSEHWLRHALPRQYVNNTVLQGEGPGVSAGRGSISRPDPRLVVARARWTEFRTSGYLAPAAAYRAQNTVSEVHRGMHWKSDDLLAGFIAAADPYLGSRGRNAVRNEELIDQVVLNKPAAHAPSKQYKNHGPLVCTRACAIVGLRRQDVPGMATSGLPGATVGARRHSFAV